MNEHTHRALQLAAALILSAACTQGDVTPEKRDGAGVGGAVSLSRHQAAAFPTERAESVMATEELGALGRVLDPLPLLQAWGGLSSARTRRINAERDLERVRALAVHSDNASARELEAAELTATEARSALALALAQVRAVWGTTEEAKLARWAAALARSEIAIARIELPAGERSLNPRSVRVSAPGLDASMRATSVIGPAGAMDPALQGRALLVALTPDPPPQGTALTAWVEGAGQPVRGVFLPASAVVWQEGVPLAFVSLAPNQFTRRTLELAAPRGDGFLVTRGVDPGERFVRVGAQQLLSSLRTPRTETE